MFKTVFAATAALVITAIPAQAQTCTRDGLKAIVANYFKAVETHNISALETAPNLRITQNGSEIKLGEGFFKTGGKSQFQRTLIDTERCGTLTQAVIDETPDPNAPPPAGRGGARGAAGPRGAAPGGAPGAGPAGPRQGGPDGAPAGARGGLPAAAPYTGPAVILAVRLKVDQGKVSEIETIVNRQGELFFSPPGVLATKDHDWEGILPPAQRSTREYMNDAANKYFSGFSLNPEVEAPFATPCDRWEGGVSTTTTTHNCSPKGFNMTHTHRRFPVTDVEAGITAGFVNFNGGLPDVHMFKIRNGKIEMIQAVFGGNAQGAIWPDEAK
jgi:hypothetical protein